MYTANFLSPWKPTPSAQKEEKGNIVPYQRVSNLNKRRTTLLLALYTMLWRTVPLCLHPTWTISSQQNRHSILYAALKQNVFLLLSLLALLFFILFSIPQHLGFRVMFTFRKENQNRKPLEIRWCICSCTYSCILRVLKHVQTAMPVFKHRNYEQFAGKSFQISEDSQTFSGRFKADANSGSGNPALKRQSNTEKKAQNRFYFIQKVRPL